jgi:SAM-dependent methyltransferase
MVLELEPIMQWKLKSLVQRNAARLPASISNAIYFRLQRHCGNLRPKRISPLNRLTIGLEFCRQIAEHGRSIDGASILEVGTGWRLNVPIACWLCGADRITTVDLNRLLRPELIRSDLSFLVRNEATILARFEPRYGDLLQESRWRALLNFASREWELPELCELLHLEYIAPGDAGCVPLERHSVDFHISSNTLEHIPAETLAKIFTEAKRVARPGALLLHQVDHTDHFSHADRNLSPINFLQYGDTQWNHYAGNRYAYVNRLREDDYLRIFRDCGLEVLATTSQPNEQVLQQLKRLALNDRFQSKPVDVLARLNSLFVLEAR